MTAKILMAAALFFSVSASAVEIDINRSSAKILNGNEFVFDNVIVGNIPGTNWARFQWNPQANGFMLVDMGAQSTGIAGRWDLSFSMNCDGTYGRTTWTLNQDGTCVSGENRVCRWNFNAGSGDFNLNYITGGGTSYRGRLDHGALAGNFSNPNGTVRGCWNAVRMQRLNFTPSKPAPKTGIDSSGSPAGR